MSDPEIRDEEREWQRFRNAINAARAGYRQVFVD